MKRFKTIPVTEEVDYETYVTDVRVCFKNRGPRWFTIHKKVTVGAMVEVAKDMHTEISEVLEATTPVLKEFRKYVKSTARAHTIDSLPANWRSSNRGNTLRAGNILIIASRDDYYTFPMKGKYVKSKKDAHLFFAADAGKDTLDAHFSRERGRFVPDSAIATREIEEGAKYTSLDRSYVYIVK